ncbi:MAG: hypothetical protein Q8O99_05235 [bacterium]|nr:hypothetical protein [bacterium]
MLPAGRTDIDKKSQEILISKLKEQLGNAVIEDWQTRIDTLDDFLTPAQEMLYQIENDVLLADDTRPNLLERLITQRVSLIRGAIAQVMLPEVDSFR